MNIDYYLNKEYSNPPCWDFVSDFFTRERGITLEHFTCENSPKEIAKAFRIAILNYKQEFDEVIEREDFCIALCSKHLGGSVTHVGICLGGGIIHCDGNVQINDLATFKMTYPFITYYKLKEGES